MYLDGITNGLAGTGKTTVARKMAEFYYEIGILSTKEYVECSASDLVAQYVGQSGPKTREALTKALGKVLFIDEAYRLLLLLGARMDPRSARKLTQ